MDDMAKSIDDTISKVIETLGENARLTEAIAKRLELFNPLVEKLNSYLDDEPIGCDWDY